jgi:hypothetical protein
VRRRRKKEWLDVRKGKSTAKLLTMLVLALAFMWYLGTRF